MDIIIIKYSLSSAILSEKLHPFYKVYNSEKRFFEKEMPAIYTPGEPVDFLWTFLWTKM